MNEYDSGDVNAQAFYYSVLGSYIYINNFDLADLKAYANNELDINSVHVIVFMNIDHGDETYTDLDLIFTVNDFLACLPAEEVEEALNYWREELELAIDDFGFKVGAEALSELSIVKSAKADRLESIKIGDKVFAVGGDAIVDVDRLPGSGDASKLYRLRTTETEEREETAKSTRLFLRNVRHMTEQEWQDYLQGLRDSGEIGEENVDWFGFISDEEVDGEGRIDYYLYVSFEAIMRAFNSNIQVSTEMIEPDGSGDVMSGFRQAVQELGVGNTSDADWSDGQFSRYKVCICPDSCTFDIYDEYSELAHTSYEDLPSLIAQSNVVILCARERERQDVAGEYLYDVYDCTPSDFIALMSGEEPQNDHAEEVPVNMIETFDMDGIEDWAAEVQDSGQTQEGLLIEMTQKEAVPEVIESYALYVSNGSSWERIVTEQTPTADSISIDGEFLEITEWRWNNSNIKTTDELIDLLNEKHYKELANAVKRIRLLKNGDSIALPIADISNAVGEGTSGYIACGLVAEGDFDENNWQDGNTIENQFEWITVDSDAPFIAHVGNFSSASDKKLIMVIACKAGR